MTREELEQEFITLRNSRHTVIKSYHSKMLRNSYYDYLNDSDTLARLKTDEELIKAIEKLKDTLHSIKAVQ